ncbi:MAG TPA: carbonic anhydrase, partial [Allocoleopsis sp.]
LTIKSMEKLIKGLHKFQDDYFTTHRELFQKLSKGQQPRILFITCCDSRINPNLITQTEPGEIFIMRNIGNIIPAYGATNGGEGAGIEYAVQALKIESLIVCGHSDCGAIKGLLDLNSLAEDMPLVHNWLKHAEATRRLMKENYNHLDKNALMSITIQENVLTQIENLRTYPIIRSRLRSGQMQLHAWVYQIETGKVFAYDTAEAQFSPL